MTEKYYAFYEDPNDVPPDPKLHEFAQEGDLLTWLKKIPSREMAEQGGLKIILGQEIEISQKTTVTEWVLAE